MVASLALWHVTSLAALHSQHYGVSSSYSYVSYFFFYYPPLKAGAAKQLGTPPNPKVRESTGPQVHRPSLRSGANTGDVEEICCILAADVLWWSDDHDAIDPEGIYMTFTDKQLTRQAKELATRAHTARMNCSLDHVSVSGKTLVEVDIFFEEVQNEIRKARQIIAEEIDARRNR